MGLAKRVRLAPEVRRAQLVEAAARLLLTEGRLPLPLDRLADEAGVSKTLVYAYFATQYDLFNAVLEKELEVLCEAGVEAASRRPGLAEAAAETADIYFEHVAKRGPVVHFVMRDSYMARRLSPQVLRRRDRVARNLARQVRRELNLPLNEVLAAINMVVTIPEEAGRLVYEGAQDLEAGRALTRMLVASSLSALRPS